MEEIAEAVAGLGAQMAVDEMKKKKRGKKKGAPKGRRGKKRTRRR